MPLAARRVRAGRDRVRVVAESVRIPPSRSAGLAGFMGLVAAVLIPFGNGGAPEVPVVEGCLAAEQEVCACTALRPPLRWALGLPLPLNRIGPEDLALLPGIGERRAAAIVDDRLRRGPYGTVGALGRVRSIGPRTVDRLRPFLFVGEVEPRCGS